MTSAAAAVLTVSDGVTQGTRADDSGDLALALLTDAGYGATIGMEWHTRARPDGGWVS